MEQNTYHVHTSDEQKLFVKTWGNPKNVPIVLVHGYPDNHEVWEPIATILADKYYVITYDVRGAGKSSIAKSTKDYRLARLSKDLAEVTEYIIPNKPFHLAAHDWGSIQSWESVTDPKFKAKLLSYSTISGPCLDHASFWLRRMAKRSPKFLLKQLTKSWYIYMFHLPFIAPTVWHFFSTKQWNRVLTRLEGQKDLPVNENISADGKYGVSLYRANFIPALTIPRKRYAQCPVQAIVLDRDTFVSPELIDEMPHWTQPLKITHVDANHWAILSQPERMAQLIADFAYVHTPSYLLKKR